MNFLVYLNDVYHKLDCGCEIVVFDTEKFTYLLNYCKGSETPKEHMEKMKNFVIDEFKQKTQTNQLMSMFNA